MSIEKVRAYFKPLGIEERIREFDVSSATVELAAVAVGACLCFPPDRKGRTILRTIEKERCTVLTAVPTLFSVLLKRYREEPCDLSSLQTGMIGGSTYSPQLYQEICRTFDFTLLPSSFVASGMW